MYAEVIFPIGPRSFTFLAGSAKPGDAVAAPLAGRERYGLVLRLHSTAPPVAAQAITRITASSLVPTSQLLLLEHLLTVHRAPPASALPCIVPKRLLSGTALRTTMPVLSPASYCVPTLTAAQKKALLAIQSTPTPSLLFGITGSGKTEIYRALISSAIQKGKSCLLLAPEISLVDMLARRLYGLTECMTIYHSGLSPQRRASVWQAARLGKTRFIIATRSGCFLPLQNLGCVILDEEHDRSYKHDATPRYHARSISFLRAQHSKVKVVLASATPSVESYFLSSKKKMHTVRLATRATGARLPTVSVLDRNAEPPHTRKQLLSEKLVSSMKETLSRKEKVMLLFNRRGLEHSFSCQDCAEVITCKSCSSALVRHNHNSLLLCHQCGLWQPAPIRCSTCGSHALSPKGVGIQMLHAQLALLFPKERIMRIDHDTTTGSAAEALSSFSQTADILIGTQMIAKGHDTADITLVGIIGIDSLLHLPDLRASEHVFHMLTQAAGRSGRGTLPGRVLVQTALPRHPAITFAAKHDSEGFLKNELIERARYKLPPVQKAVTVWCAHTSELAAKQRAKRLAEKLVAAGSTATVMAALTVKKKNQYIFGVHFLGDSIDTFWRAAGTLPPQSVVDIDPMQF